MNKITLIFLLTFFFSFSSFSQVTVGENGKIELKAGATLDVAGLEITPTSDYDIGSGVTIQKSNTSVTLPNGESMLRSYYMDPMLEGLSGTLVFNYEEDDMNGITHDADMVVVDDSGNSMEYEDTDDLDFQITSEFEEPTNFAIVTAEEATLSVETLDGDMMISLYPNPTSSILNIQFDKDLKTTIYNMLGQEIIQSEQKQIDVSGLERGTYIVLIQNLETQNITNFKLIKE